MRRKNWKQVVASALSAGMVMSTMPQMPVMAAGEDAQATVYETTEQEAEDNAQESVDDALVDSEISEEQGETAEEATEASEEISEEASEESSEEAESEEAESEEAESEEAESEETADEETESGDVEKTEEESADASDEETKEMESEEVAETATEEEDAPETAEEATDEAEEETDSETEEETDIDEETDAEIEEDADFEPAPVRFVQVDENGVPLLQATVDPDDEEINKNGWVIWYRENIEGDAEIVSYEEPNGANKNLEIPSVIKDMKVVAIMDYAFQNCALMNSVKIPDSVTKIGFGAFQNCTSLRKVTLPSKLKEIGGAAFANCASLTKITIPKSLTVSKASGRYDGVFSGCGKLTAVTFEEGIKSVPQGLFGGCTGLKTVTMPSGIKTIETGAFEGCENLTTVAFPDTLVEVGTSAFSGCTSLANVNMPDSVVTIQNNAFMDCIAITKLKLPKYTTFIGDSAFQRLTNLTSLTLPSELRTLGAAAFAECEKLPKVQIPKKLEATTCYSIYQLGPFGKCKSLKTVTFEENTKIVANYLLCQCDGIEKISLNDTITEIKPGAFAVCEKLSQVNLCESVATIGENAFYQCAEIKTIKLPSHLKTIGVQAFMYCAKLQEITIPNQVTHVYERAFYECKKMTKAKLSSTLQYLGQGAFGDCVGLTSINIPKTLTTSTGDLNSGGPFLNCENLKTVTFTAGIPTISPYLFAACTGLEKITIPNTVTTMQDGAFALAYNLKNITLSDATESLGNACFYKCAKLKSLVMPNTVTYIGPSLCSQCSNMTKLSLSNQLETINNNAFEYCSSLENVTIPASVKYINYAAFLESGLTSIKLTNNVEYIGDLAFNKCLKLASVDLAKGVKTIMSRAFENCDALKTITFPDSLTFLGESAFNDCDALYSITFGTGLTSIPKFCFYRNQQLKEVRLPYTITALYEGAFGQCTRLNKMHMPKDLNTIEKDVLSYSEYMIIYGVKGSYAETYAKENKFTFQEETVDAKKVTLDRTELYIPVGTTYKFTTTVTPNNVTSGFVWRGTNDNVIEVSQDGTIVAKAIGDATVRVFVGETMAVCEVHVVTGVQQVVFNTGSMEMKCGQKKQIVASVAPDNAYDKSLTWVTTDAKVAKVDKNGNVTAVSAGQCYITAIANDGSGAQCSCFITVSGSMYEVDDATKMESQHNYKKECSDVWKYSVIGADSITLTFDSKTQIAAADYLIIMDRDGNEVGKFTKKELAGKSVTVKSDTVMIRFDAPVGNQWGFKVKKATYKKLKVTERFSDLDPNAWYISAVEYISDRRIMNGKGNKKFAPNATITRAEFVTVLWNLEENPAMQYSYIFSDVPGGQWYTEPVMWAYQSGVTRGYGSTFGTNDNIQRQQLVTMLYSYAKLKGYDTKFSKDSIKSFMDYGNVAVYAEDAMNWAIGNQIISGSKQNNGKYALKPEGQATRAECAQMVKQFLLNVAKEK